MIELFFYNLFVLIVLHFIADFAFQSDAMAKGKNRHNEENNYWRWVKELGRDPNKFRKTWYYYLTAHSLIQGGLILLVFGVWWISLIEAITHWIIDFIKCEERINLHVDQGLHITLKILDAWWLI